MGKKNRLLDIEKLILEHEIDTQEELTSKLNGLGYDVSQATVSRDINELKLIKVKGSEKKFKYAKFGKIDEEVPEHLKSIFKQVTVSVKSANNLVVVKTLSGNASAVGMAVDGMKIGGILGSVAGDDVLLIIAENNDNAILIENLLKSIL